MKVNFASKVMQVVLVLMIF